MKRAEERTEPFEELGDELKYLSSLTTNCKLDRGKKTLVPCYFLFYYLDYSL